MDLIEFRRALRRHLRPSLLVAILVLVLGLLALGQPAQKYQATSTLLVTPRAERFQNASESVLRVIFPNVVVVAQSASLHDAARPSVPPAYARAGVTVSAAFDSQSSSVALSASSVNPDAAVAWSRALSQALVERLKGDPYVVAQLLDPADGAGVVGKKARLLSIGAVFVLALFSFVLVAFGVQRLEEARDITGALRRRGVRVLGSVATGRSRRRKTDRRAVIVSALLHDDIDNPRVLVTALADESLIQRLTDLLARGDDDLVAMFASPDADQDDLRDPGDTAAVDRLDVVAGPLLDRLCLRSSVEHDHPTCILAVDTRVSSVNDVVSGVRAMERAGIECRGAVLVYDSRRFRRANHRDEAFTS